MLVLQLPVPPLERERFNAVSVRPAVAFKQKSSRMQAMWRVLHEDPPAPGLPQGLVYEAMGHSE